MIAGLSDIPGGGVLVGIAAVWVAALVAWVALQVARVRVPAFVFWGFPAAMVTTGAVLTGLELLEVGAGAMLPVAEASSSLWLALMITACGLAMGALPIAAANLVRAGERSRWTPLHALGVIPAVLGTLLGGLSGPLAFGLGAVATAALGVSALRLGRSRRDGGRMVATRALVASMGVGSAVCLAAGHVFGVRMNWATVWATAPFVDRQDQLDAVMAPALRVLVGDLSVAVGLVVAAAAVMIPVSRYVLDGRSSVGAVLAGFMMLGATGAVVPAALPLLRMEAVDEVGLRQAALAAEGISLAESDEGDGWAPGLSVTVGVYWVLVDGERVTPIRSGAVAWEDLEDGAARGVLEAARGHGPVVLELDRRAGMGAVAPVLLGLQRAERREVCVVVRSAAGRFACLPVRLDGSEEAMTHVLLESAAVLVVEGEGVEEVPFGQLTRRLAGSAGPRALHVNREVSAQRLVQGLLALRAVGVEATILVVD